MFAEPDRSDEALAPLHADVRRLGGILGETIAEQSGEGALALVEGVRRAAVALRRGELDGGRQAFARRFALLSLDELELLSRACTQFFHLMNAAEEQHRIRMLRRRDRPEAPPDGSIAAACAEVAAQGVSADEIRGLLERLFVMPVLTAHPTEARRRTMLDHLADVAAALDALDDPRPGARERERILARLREAVMASYLTEEARPSRPSPLDEVRAGLHVFERTLLHVTPAIYRALEEGLAAAYPGERFEIGPFLRWGTWIGGDRDGNPNVTSDVTRMTLERHRQLAIAAYLADLEALGRQLSISARRVRPDGLALLERSLAEDRARLPEVTARVRRYAEIEPWREKLAYMRARLEATRVRGDVAYAQVGEYVDDLSILERTLAECGLARLAAGRLRDAQRRAEVFGFHLATLDLRQHSSVHERAVAELLARGGVEGYAALDEEARIRVLGGLLDRADVGPPRDRGGLSPETRELLASLEVIGRARRDLGREACERYVISFSSAPSDVLEILLLCRAAGLTPDEIRPVPLFEQLEDLEGAERTVARLVALRPVRVALRGELEVMIGYSDSGKQAGYVASAVALRRAQEAVARVADEAGLTLTIFHGRGGAVGRGGGPANRAIRAQPRAALRGRLRVTEQGETIAARYGRPEIARRDLEQMIHAVILGSVGPEDGAWPEARREREALLSRAAERSRDAYRALLSDEERMARYAAAATPILEVAALPIASRPASRRPGLSFEDLRAIPWVFSWNQSRHGLPGWYGLGTALDAIIEEVGVEGARRLYAEWPFFRALVDNAQLALVRADIDVAAEYARLADEDARQLFEAIRAEHSRTVARVLETTGDRELLSAWPTLARTVARRNPYVDILSHAQIELLRRLRASPPEEQPRIREVLFITINGIAAGLQTAG